MTLKGQITSGLKWSAFSKGASQIVSWVVTIYVIRLLAPSDYGLMAMASVVIAFLSTFNEFGLGSALVQSKKLEDENIGAVYGAMLLIGMLLTGLLAVSSPWFAGFFNEPQLQALIAVAGLQFILSAGTVVPESMMRRNMAFKPLSLADLSGAIFGSLSTLILALTNYGVWSLVLGNLMGAFIRSVVLVALNPRRVSPNFRLQGAFNFLSFGGYITAARIIAYFASQADILIGAKLLGKEALGLYSIAMQLASLPVDKTMSVVNQIAFSAVSRLQDRPNEMQIGLTKAIRWLVNLIFPIVFGLASVAPEFIPLVFGAEWNPTVRLLQLIAIVIPIKMLSALFATTVIGLGRADIAFKNTLVGAVVLPCFFLVGAQWNTVGLATAWTLGLPVVFILNFRRSSAVIGYNAQKLFKVLVNPSVSAFCMIFAIYFIRHSQIYNGVSWVSLSILIISGGLSYCCVLILLDSEFRLHLKSAFRNKI